MGFGKSSVVAILGVAVGLALMVAVAGWQMSRRIDWVPVVGTEGWWEEGFEESVARIGDLEKDWEEALDRLAGQHKEGGTATIDVAGVSGAYRLDARHEEATLIDGVAVDMPPVLGRFAGEKEAWVFPDSALSQRGFIEEDDRPLVYVRGDGEEAAILILDRAAAAEVAVKTAGLPQGAEGDRGTWRWISPGQSDEAAESRRADESIRHLSRFGPWTMKIWNPVESRVSYSMPVLTGGFALAGVLVVGGGLVAWIQWRTMRMAARQVSFANQVSHELRTPLTNLMLNADLAMDALDDRSDPAGMRVHAIREEAQRLSKTIEQVLDFARCDRSEGGVEEIDLKGLIRSMASRFEMSFARRGMELIVECPHPAVVRADRSALERILLNLLSNAERYAGRESTVKVGIVRGEEGWEIEVADDGAGVPKGSERRIFAPFERGDRSTSEGSSGTGLGLSISRELAKRMGGQLIWLPSKRGATFRLSLPDRERRAG